MPPPVTPEHSDRPRRSFVGSSRNLLRIAWLAVLVVSIVLAPRLNDRMALYHALLLPGGWLWLPSVLGLILLWQLGGLLGLRSRYLRRGMCHARRWSFFRWLSLAAVVYAFVIFAISRHRDLMWYGRPFGFGGGIESGGYVLLWDPAATIWPGAGLYTDERSSGVTGVGSWLPLFGHESMSGPGLACYIPTWIMVVLTAVPAAIFCRSRPIGPDAPICQNCAYNLTGNVSGRCPECGSPV